MKGSALNFRFNSKTTIQDETSMLRNQNMLPGVFLMMQRNLLALTMLAGLVLNAPAAHAGLVEYVYHNIPAIAFTPTDASISAVQASAAAAQPNYSFINTADTFNYNGGNSQTNTFFGTDAAGAAATDTANIDQSAFDAKGVLNISAAGNYTFNIANADDAARVYLSGALIAEQNFPGSGLSTPSSSVRSLSVGSYAFELFYYQQTGGANLNFAISGPAATAFTQSTCGGDHALILSGLWGFGECVGHSRRCAW